MSARCGHGLCRGWERVATFNGGAGTIYGGGRPESRLKTHGFSAVLLQPRDRNKPIPCEGLCPAELASQRPSRWQLPRAHGVAGKPNHGLSCRNSRSERGSRDYRAPSTWGVVLFRLSMTERRPPSGAVSVDGPILRGVVVLARQRLPSLPCCWSASA